MGYASVLYNREELPWKGNIKEKPNEIRCFRFQAKIPGNPDEITFYFCIYNKRTDWGGRRDKISLSQAMYINDNWVAALNMKLHTFNLEENQEKMKRTVASVDCNSHTMEPIKFEIRLRVIYILNT